jgi:hypothetical protein
VISALNRGPSVAAMSSPTSGGRQACPKQLEDVVGGGHQGAFPVHLLKPSQSEGIQTSGPFDLAKDWLDNGLTQGVDRMASFGAEFSIHPASASRSLSGLKDNHEAQIKLQTNIPISLDAQ